MKFPFFSKTPKSEIYLTLDIGTTAVHALIFERREEEIFVLGDGLEYFDKFRAFEEGKFEVEVAKKAISMAIQEAEKKSGKKPKLVFLGLSPDIFTGRVISHLYQRKEKKLIDEKEEREIKEVVLKEAKKRIAQNYALEKMILPEDLEFRSLRILDIKLDGYPVSSLIGYNGEQCEFKILASFLPRYYLDSNFSTSLFPPIISIIKEMGFKILEIRHPVDGLIRFLFKYPNAIFIDIGGEVTQIFLVKNEILEQISEFKIGGEQFSQVLSENLGLSELEARNLKIRYSKGELTEESRKIIGKLLKIPLQLWFKSLKKTLMEMGSGVFPFEIFIFGGGSFLPEIKEVLENGDWQDVYFFGPIQVKSIDPQNLISKIKIRGPEHISSILISLGIYEKKIF